MSSKLSADDWSRYWEGATITTFQNRFLDNYTGDIYEFWLANMTGELSHVVDLACGNGALTWIANDLLNGDDRKVKITGVDIADISPFKRLGKKRSQFPCVSFVGSTPIEKLPFANGSVDLVVSQYGVEYSDFEKTIPEIGRVLAANGRVCFIMHLSHSALVLTEGRMLAACRAVLEEDRLHEQYLRLDQLYREGAGDNQADVQCVKIEIRHLTFRARNRFVGFRTRHDFENYIYLMEKVFSDNTPKKSKKREKIIIEARDTLGAFVSRLEDLMLAALEPKNVDELVELLEREGLSIAEKRELHVEGGALWGLGLVAVR